MFVVQFREDYGIVLDEQLIMHRRCNVERLLEQITTHLKHSSAELEDLGRKTVEENHPNMVAQFDFDYFKE